MTLNKLGTNGTKLIVAQCAVVVTPDLSRDLVLSVSMIPEVDGGSTDSRAVTG